MGEHESGARCAPARNKNPLRGHCFVYILRVCGLVRLVRVCGRRRARGGRNLRKENRKKKGDQDLGVLIIKFSIARATMIIFLHLLLKLILDQLWHGLLRTRRSLPNRERNNDAKHNHPGHLIHFCSNPIRIALHLVW